MNNEPRQASIRVVSNTVVCCIIARELFISLQEEDGFLRQESIRVDDSFGMCDFDFPKQNEIDQEMGTAHHLFAYLGWSPSFDSPCFRALHEFFPGALPDMVVHARSRDVLSDARFGLIPHNTIFGTSICPDEINALKGSLNQVMRNYWGKCLPLGGISGIPFTGKTGFKAFSAHVPVDGNVFVVFGPHVGITKEGVMGKYHRRGQRKESTACGAVIGAFNACSHENFQDAEFDPSDMQMSLIKEKIAPHVEKIKKFKDPTALLTHYAYEMVKSATEAVVNTDFGKGYLVLLGGIQINMPAPHADHFLPIMFEAHKAGQDEPIDLLSSLRLTHQRRRSSSLSGVEVIHDPYA